MRICKSILSGITAIVFALSTIIPAIASEQNKLEISVYNPGEDGIFAVSSEIIIGTNEVALIDAQFSTRDAAQLVKQIKATGKPLKTIFISHSDPDYYFGG